MIFSFQHQACCALTYFHFLGRFLRDRNPFLPRADSFNPDRGRVPCGILTLAISLPLRLSRVCRQVRSRFCYGLGDGTGALLFASAGFHRHSIKRPCRAAVPKKRLRIAAPYTACWITFKGKPAAPDIAERKLSVSLHIAGESGPMTWHAKTLQTSYVSGQSEDEGAFP